MKLLFRIVTFILFVIFFGFALKNTEEVTLRFFLDSTVSAPLVLLLLAFFVAGTISGVLAMTPMLFRYHRDLSKHKKTMQTMQNQNEGQQSTPIQPPQPATIVKK